MFDTSKHHGNKYGGVLWNPKVFRRWLPAQFTQRLSDPVYVSILKERDYAPCTITNIPSVKYRGYFYVAHVVLAGLVGIDDSFLESSVCYFLRKALTAIKDKDKDTARNYLAEICDGSEFLSKRLLSTLKGYAKLHDQIPSEGMVYEERIRKIVYVPNKDEFFMYQRITAKYDRKYNITTDWSNLVPSYAVKTFTEIGDPSDPTLWYDATKFWRAGLFYTALDNEVFNNGVSFEDAFKIACELTSNDTPEAIVVRAIEYVANIKRN